MYRNSVLNSSSGTDAVSHHEVRIYGFRAFKSCEKHGEGLEIVWRRGKIKESARLVKLADSFDEGMQRFRDNPPAIFSDYEQCRQDDSDKTDSNFGNMFISMAAEAAESTDPLLWGADIIPFHGMSAADTLYFVLCACCRHLMIDGEWYDSENTGKIIAPEDADSAINEKSLGISSVEIKDGSIRIHYYGNMGFGGYSLFKIRDEMWWYNDEQSEYDLPNDEKADDNYCSNRSSEWNAGGIPADNTNLPQNTSQKCHAYWDSDSEDTDSPKNPRFLKLLIRCFCMNFIKYSGISEN